MHRFMNNPCTLGVSEYANRLLKMNQQLTSYPDATDCSKFQPDELIEIIEFALPEVWWKHMTLQCLIPSENNMKEVVDFCRDLEEIESSGKARMVETPASSKILLFEKDITKNRTP